MDQSYPSVPGCGPPSNLQLCQEDVANATAFISAILIDLINNDPAVAQAMMNAMVTSGVALPLLGVTNGAAAVAPQVGQDIKLTGTLPYLNGTPASGNVSLGTIPPGDWDVWLWATVTTALNGMTIALATLPAGFDHNPSAFMLTSGPPQFTLTTETVTALTTIDSLIAVAAQVSPVNGAGNGTMTINCIARRRR